MNAKEVEMDGPWRLDVLAELPNFAIAAHDLIESQV